jgi:DNA-binding NtrC family response regulator
VSEPGKDRLPTILVVDDDPWILELVKDMLASEPCRVVTTTDPVKALPLMEWERADVLLADVAMPEVDGIDLVVRARKLFPAVPRLLLTAVPTLERILRAVNEAEVYRVLVKPVSPKVLRDTLREALQHRFELRAGATAQQGSIERAERLFELEKAHPGIGSVNSVAGLYVLSPERWKEIESRFEGTAFAALLRAPSVSVTSPQVKP